MIRVSTYIPYDSVWKGTIMSIPWLALSVSAPSLGRRGRSHIMHMPRVPSRGHVIRDTVPILRTFQVAILHNQCYYQYLASYTVCGTSNIANIEHHPFQILSRTSTADMAVLLSSSPCVSSAY